MKIDDVDVGDHFWALSKGQLLVCMRSGPHVDNFDVAGAWEGGIPPQDLVFLGKITRPVGFEETPLYYADPRRDEQEHDEEEAE